MSESEKAFVEQLRAQRERYEGEKQDLRSELRRLTADLARIESAQRAVEDLLRIEAPDDFPAPKSAGAPAAELGVVSNKPFVESAFAVLSEVGGAMYYRELTEKVQAQGVSIPGKNPEQNLYAHLRRDARFVLASPGAFALRPTGSLDALAAGVGASSKPRRAKRRGRKRASKSRAKKKV